MGAGVGSWLGEEAALGLGPAPEGTVREEGNRLHHVCFCQPLLNPKDLRAGVAVSAGQLALDLQQESTSKTLG